MFVSANYDVNEMLGSFSGQLVLGNLNFPFEEVDANSDHTKPLPHPSTQSALGLDEIYVYTVRQIQEVIIISEEAQTSKYCKLNNKRGQILYNSRWKAGNKVNNKPQAQCRTVAVTWTLKQDLTTTKT